jgi:hypothetical protein
MNQPERLRGGWAEWLWAQLVRSDSPSWYLDFAGENPRHMNSNRLLELIRFDTPEGHVWWAQHVARALDGIERELPILQ